MAGPQIDDSKPAHCTPFILARLRIHRAQRPNSPFFIGLNSVQGAGKTTLVKTLRAILKGQEHLETLVCSIDDLYLRHEDQVALARRHVDNPLMQHRGQPGTHDLVLARELFTSLRDGKPVKVPQYDKSAYNGQGDRVFPSQWGEVNGPSQPKIQVIIFEGWCVGFRALSVEEIESKREASKVSASAVLWRHRLEDLLFVNEKLAEYDLITDMFDAFIHIDAEETMYVYEWRLEQEAALRREKGTGMTDEEVVRFVDSYYPAYELFTDDLRRGIFKGDDSVGGQLRLIVGRDRKVREVVQI